MNFVKILHRFPKPFLPATFIKHLLHNSVGDGERSLCSKALGNKYAHFDVFHTYFYVVYNLLTWIYPCLPGVISIWTDDRIETECLFYKRLSNFQNWKFSHLGIKRPWSSCECQNYSTKLSPPLWVTFLWPFRGAHTCGPPCLVRPFPNLQLFPNQAPLTSPSSTPVWTDTFLSIPVLPSSHHCRNWLCQLDTNLDIWEKEISLEELLPCPWAFSWLLDDLGGTGPLRVGEPVPLWVGGPGPWGREGQAPCEWEDLAPEDGRDWSPAGGRP